jgi:hypothetical protein
MEPRFVVRSNRLSKDGLPKSGARHSQAMKGYNSAVPIRYYSLIKQSRLPVRARTVPSTEGPHLRRLIVGSLILLCAHVNLAAAAAAVEPLAPDQQTVTPINPADTEKEGVKNSSTSTSKKKAHPAKTSKKKAHSAKVTKKKSRHTKIAKKPTKPTLKATGSSKKLVARPPSHPRHNSIPVSDPKKSSTSAVKNNVPPVKAASQVQSADAAGDLARKAAGNQTATRDPGHSLLSWIALPSLAGIAGGVFLWVRRRRERFEDAWVPELKEPVLGVDPADVAASSEKIKANLLQKAEPFFVDLRVASSRKDHEFILQHCTEDLATSMILDIETEPSHGTPQVDGLRAELVDIYEELNRYVASVKYTAHLQSGNQKPHKVQELWHFVHDAAPSSDWRLAAIETA